MKAYRILIHDRNYTSWEFCYADTNLPVTDNEVSALSTINPLSMKLFSRDIFTFDEKFAETTRKKTNKIQQQKH